MASEHVELADVCNLGWNSIEHDNPTLTARVHAQQLYLIGLLLVEIRDILDAPGPVGGEHGE